MTNFELNQEEADEPPPDDDFSLEDLVDEDSSIEQVDEAPEAKTPRYNLPENDWTGDYEFTAYENLLDSSTYEDQLDRVLNDEQPSLYSEGFNEVEDPFQADFFSSFLSYILEPIDTDVDPDPFSAGEEDDELTRIWKYFVRKLEEKRIITETRAYRSFCYSS
ncbi:MAG: hypothetical protein KKA62_02290 [Nanoarchaeota archaeon]|nr:hypothetical protein [Nanoarchaeota archaeon]MBU1643665.1 hypothetical protein [Nanoarchaeota archaeon]MBU1976763.1 hypothetical protein [Nanoarchaeota archaeon]